MTEEQKHTAGYEVTPTEIGFRVSPRGKKLNTREVIAELDTYGFWHLFTIDDTLLEEFPTEPPGWNYNDSRIPMHFYHRLSDSVVDALYYNWVPEHPPKRKIKSEAKLRASFDELYGEGASLLPHYNSSFAEYRAQTNAFVPLPVSQWAKKTTGKTLNARLLEQWKIQCDRISPEVENLHKKLYSASGGRSGDWKNLRVAFEKGNEFLLEDVGKYRAAAMSLLYGEPERVDEDWRLTFAYNGVITGALNKTLMNLPGGISQIDALEIEKYNLRESITNRYKLFAYNAAYSEFRHPTYNTVGRNIDKAFHIVLRSTPETIQKAISYMWGYFPDNNTGDFRRTKKIKETLMMIFDYGGDYGDWDIMGLARRSEVYHHDLREQRRIQEEQRQKHDEELKLANTMLPPIPLPSNPNIKFLETYGAVVEEGNIMEHCIAQYARRAVDGNSYLFHVDYKGNPASVEVSPDGYVRQSYGKKDKKNSASKYAEQELRKWAKKLKEHVDKTLPNPTGARSMAEVGQVIDRGYANAEIPF